MRGNLPRTLNFLNGAVNLNASDFASDSDNQWTDGANVDAHVYAGYTYDYYFKRFGRRGLDNANIRIRSLTHPVNRQDAFASSSVFDTFYVNAFYAGDGIMVYGEGLPPNIFRRSAVELHVGVARRGGPRAHARRHRLFVAADIRQRVWRAERGLLRHHGDGGHLLLPAARHRQRLG